MSSDERPSGDSTLAPDFELAIDLFRSEFSAVESVGYRRSGMDRQSCRLIHFTVLMRAIAAVR